MCAFRLPRGAPHSQMIELHVGAARAGSHRLVPRPQRKPSATQVSQLEERLEAAQAAAGEAEERAGSAAAEAEDVRVSPKHSCSGMRVSG